MTKAPVRVRFAPSPTGMMHLGSIRTALMNYLFAAQKQGTFIIRVEDTDFERNFDAGAQQILKDLAWAGLNYQEGPEMGGSYGPYFQSQRTAIYKEKLQEFQQKNLIYRCFCSPEELDKKRQRQLALKQPPRYDRACLKLSMQALEENLKNEVPFIWRFKLNQDESVAVTDLAHGTINFDMKSFSDVPLTRQDGSFTFMFANFVDDLLMEITHVLRGEDHLSNTAGQVAMYQACAITPPIFWHLPILCNVEGKKLSKRDFGFSLNDLRNAGYLPEALNNYLGIIGASFEQEIMSLNELAQAMNFEHINPTSQIKYDVEKLKWINHKWINRYSVEQLTEACKPYLLESYKQVSTIPYENLLKLIEIIRTDLITLHDVVPALEFYFKAPVLTSHNFASVPPQDLLIIKNLVMQYINLLDSSVDEFLINLKRDAAQKKIGLKNLFVTLRIALTGKGQGINIHDLIIMLGVEESKKRFNQLKTVN